MDLLAVAEILLVTEGYGYLAQNTAQAQREETTQRSKERKEGDLCAGLLKQGTSDTPVTRK